MKRKQPNQKINGIYAITPNRSLNLLQVEQVLVQHRVAILQYRHKTEDIHRKQNEALALRQLCTQHHTLFIVNDDIKLAKKVQADGVHLGKNDDSIANAREALGARAMIGVSCYNALSLALNAQQQGADYVAFGALFPSTTKPEAIPCSLDIIAQARQQLSLPIVGVGGINFDNQQQAIAAGCDAVAMIAALFDAKHKLAPIASDKPKPCQ